MKTADLTGPALDWAVAICQNVELDENHNGIWFDDNDKPIDYSPSTDWAQGGPIIEREHIGVWFSGPWHAKYDGCEPHQVQDADTPLIAAMRCYVAAKLGDTVEVPIDLL